MEDNKARKALGDAVSILNLSHAYWWIEAGTFLGCIREGGRFIGHDKDIDIGVKITDNVEILYAEMLHAGFIVNHIFGENEKGLEIAFERDGIKIDFFFFYEDGKKWWHGAWRGGKMIRLEFERNLLADRNVEIMEGIEVFTPCDPDAYLTARYGDWRTPNKEWRWDTDPLCINWEKSEISKREILEKWKHV